MPKRYNCQLFHLAHSILKEIWCNPVKICFHYGTHPHIHPCCSTKFSAHILHTIRPTNEACHNCQSSNALEENNICKFIDTSIFTWSYVALAYLGWGYADTMFELIVAAKCRLDFLIVWKSMRPRRTKARPGTNGGVITADIDLSWEFGPSFE